MPALSRANTPSYGRTGGDIEAFFSDRGPLARLKEGYARREEQVRLARRVDRAIGAHETLLADAPTGTGKTIAYLAGPILRGEKLVVSTATIALQHQLLLEELPLLQRALSIHTGGERELSFGLLKGRSNFLCQSRLESTFLSGKLLDRQLLERINAWSTQTETGDREEIPFPLKRSTWLEVAADANDCVRHACRHGDTCWYFSQREEAESADILVVNHALLMANVASNYNVFGMEGRHLILDEAHRVEESMAGSFGAHVTHYRVSYVCRSVSKRAPEVGRYTQDLESAADLFFDALRTRKALTQDPPPHYDRMLASLTALRKVLASNSREEVNKLATMVSRLSGDLRSFYTPPSNEAQETHARALLPAKQAPSGGVSYPELKSWLVETAGVFLEEIAGRPTGGATGGATILTSATLAAGKSFSYTRRRLGLDHPEAMAGEFLGEEIFDYKKNCLVYLERELPEPSSSEMFTERCIKRCEELVGISGGRALILLSTHRALSRFKRSFRPPFPVRFQGDGSPTKLASWLKESDGGILVGTRTLWEGVSLDGPCVSLVVVDRVPFPAPDDPVIELLSKKAGPRWFPEVSMPRAQVALRQGSGRLIRTVDDRGVVAVLDSRLASKRWGKTMVRTSLPAAPLIHSLEDVKSFFA